jgi:apolipoprotein N-acyltransferase
MRAAETHRSVVVASNMDPSLVIDPFGRVIAQNSSGSGMRLAVAAAPLLTDRSLYIMIGDLFVVGCGIFLLASAFGSRLNAYRARD